MMQEYEKAFRIAENLEQIYDHKDRLAYWDRYPDVFGNASIIVFDTQKKIYGSFHGILQSHLSDELGGDSERYKPFWIFPANSTEFDPFMLWCVGKSRQGKITTIMDEPYYWKRIEQNQFREDFLTNLLTAAEENRNRVSSERSAWVLEEMSNEEAGKCFFYYGNRDFSEGEIEGIWGTTATLFIVCMNIKTRSLPEYGQLFFQYFDGYHTASMVKFLRLQKKRLEAGEDKWFIPQIPPAPVEVEKEEISGTATPIPETQNQFEVSKLSGRQKILQYFYEGGKMVERKHKDYNDYITFSSPQKRLAYPNESQSKLKPLIKDIEGVIRFLSGKAKQQAETELNTLIGRLTVEK